MCFLRTKFGASPSLFLVERMTTSTHKLFMFIIFGSLGLWVTVAFPPSHIRPVLHISHHVVHCYTMLHNHHQFSSRPWTKLLQEASAMPIGEKPVGALLRVAGAVWCCVHVARSGMWKSLEIWSVKYHVFYFSTNLISWNAPPTRQARRGIVPFECRQATQTARAQQWEGSAERQSRSCQCKRSEAWLGTKKVPHGLVVHPTTVPWGNWGCNLQWCPSWSILLLENCCRKNVLLFLHSGLIHCRKGTYCNHLLNQSKSETWGHSCGASGTWQIRKFQHETSTIISHQPLWTHLCQASISLVHHQQAPLTNQTILSDSPSWNNAIWSYFNVPLWKKCSIINHHSGDVAINGSS